jgi:hypothetical protein
MADIVQALLSLRPNVSWELQDPDDYASLKWFGTDEPPTIEEINIEIVRLEEKEISDKVAAETAKQTAQAKLAKLGLTPEDLKALLG